MPADPRVHDLFGHPCAPGLHGNHCTNPVHSYYCPTFDANHPPRHSCPDDECLTCGARDCGDPLHYHHDGCPSCAFNEE
jgi:hypothetical protein